jgi:hypothetical protein
MLLTESIAEKTQYEELHAARLQKEAELAAAFQAEESAKASLLAKFRRLAQVSAASEGMTEPIGKELGYNIRSANVAHKIGDEVPLCFMDLQPNIVIIHWGTNPGNERINRKPKWAIGVLIYRRLEEGGSMIFVDTDTSSPYRDHLPAGSHATYQLAYFGRGDKAVGNRSPEYSVTVGG